MIRPFVAFVLALTLAALNVAAPARAQEMWSHPESGVSIARQIGDLRQRDERDNSDGARTDVFMQFGSGDTVVTFYVYRSTYPNVALWFERTRIAMAQTVGSEGVRVEPRSFTLGNAPAPNGLREELTISAQNMMQARATGVAIAQVGEWIVKARVTSRSLDRAGVAEVMDRLLAAVRLSRAPTAVLPLRVPAACRDPNRMNASQVRAPAAAAVSAAAQQGRSAYSEVRGQGGLAADPSSWCRDTTQLPAQYGTVYRRLTGSGWVALLGDSGLAISAERFDLPGPAGAALFASTTATTQVAALFYGVPHPDAAIPVALPVLIGDSHGLAEVGAPRR